MLCIDTENVNANSTLCKWIYIYNLSGLPTPLDMLGLLQLWLSTLICVFQYILLECFLSKTLVSAKLVTFLSWGMSQRVTKCLLLSWSLNSSSTNSAFGTWTLQGLCSVCTGQSGWRGQAAGRTFPVFSNLNASVQIIPQRAEHVVILWQHRCSSSTFDLLVNLVAWIDDLG